MQSEITEQEAQIIINRRLARPWREIFQRFIKALSLSARLRFGFILAAFTTFFIFQLVFSLPTPIINTFILPDGERITGIADSLYYNGMPLSKIDVPWFSQGDNLRAFITLICIDISLIFLFVYARKLPTLSTILGERDIHQETIDLWKITGELPPKAKKG